MTIFYIITAVLLVAGVIVLLNLTPKQVAEDLMEIIRPKDKLKSKVSDAQSHKRKRGLYSTLMTLKESLEATGRGKFFPLTFSASFAAAIGGVVLAMALGNPFLIPAFALGFGLLPFGYVFSTIRTYQTQLDQEMETALSVITNSYLRTNNLVQSVSENLSYIKPPLQNIFQNFVGDATYISSNVKQAIYNMRDKVDDEVFYEWCTTLIQCQDDRTLRDNLTPIVGKLTDIRLVNNQLKGMLMASRMEFATMAGLVVFNIPLLYFLNKDWYATLMHTGAGKFIIGLCALAIVITTVIMLRFTRPIKYNG